MSQYTTESVPSFTYTETDIQETSDWRVNWMDVCAQLPQEF